MYNSHVPTCYLNGYKRLPGFVVITVLIFSFVNTAWSAPNDPGPVRAPLPQEMQVESTGSINTVANKELASDVDDSGNAGAALEKEATVATAEHEAAAEEKEKRKKQASVAAGLLLLFGILVVGMLLLYMTIRWGRLLKKTIHQPVTYTAPVDDFWYLARKPAGSENSPAPKLDANGNHSGSDDRT